VNWIGEIPPDEPGEMKLSGDLLRLPQP
jgi:hypothetical protein